MCEPLLLQSYLAISQQLHYQVAMPRPRKDSALDSRIASIAQQMAAELVGAVREHLADEVATVLGGRRGGAAPNGHAKPAASKRRRGGGVSDAVVGQLLAAIKATPGMRSEQLYEKVSAPSSVAKAGLAKLREQKKVKTSGTRRGMTYKAA